MKGYRISTGKEKKVYVYINVITKDEQRQVDYLINTGYKQVLKVKDVDKIKKNNAKLKDALSEVKKEDLKQWFKEKNITEFTINTKSFNEHFTDIDEMFNTKRAFMAIKASVRKQYPNYPKTTKAEE